MSQRVIHNPAPTPEPAGESNAGGDSFPFLGYAAPVSVCTMLLFELPSANARAPLFILVHPAYRVRSLNHPKLGFLITLGLPFGCDVNISLRLVLFRREVLMLRPVTLSPSAGRQSYL